MVYLTQINNNDIMGQNFSANDLGPVVRQTSSQYIRDTITTIRGPVISAGASIVLNWDAVCSKNRGNF
jgi:hypothetical protein